MPRPVIKIVTDILRNATAMNNDTNTTQRRSVMTDMVMALENGLKAEIEFDHDCEMPYTGDEGVKIVVISRKFINPDDGKCGSTLEDVEAWMEAEQDKWYSIPLWIYDHSGTVYDVGAENPFNCGWDSCKAGFIALKKSEWGANTDEEFFKYAQGVASEYSEWANGNCYGFVIKDEAGEQIDSCWGFIGMDAVKNEAIASAKSYNPPCMNM